MQRDFLHCLLVLLLGLMLTSCEHQTAAEAIKIEPLSPEEEYRSLLSASGATFERAEKVVTENPLYFRQRVYYQLLDKAISMKISGDDSLAEATFSEARQMAQIFQSKLDDSFLMTQHRFSTTLSNKNIHKKLQVDSLYKLGNDSLRKKNYAAADEFFENSIHIANEIGDQRRVVDNQLRQQFMLDRQKRLQESISRGKEALKLANAIGYHYRAAWILHYMALSSELLGEYAAAVGYSSRAAKAAGITKDYRCLSDTQWLEGIALYRLGRFAESVETLNHALEASIQRESLSIQAKIHNSLANSHKSLGNYSNAEENYLDSWKLFEKLDRQKDIAITQANLADLYRVMGAQDEALKMFKMAYLYYEANERHYDRIAIVKRMGDTYRNQGNLKMARKSGRSALDEILVQEKSGSDAYALLKPEAYLSLGDVERDFDNTSAAMPLYREALTAFKQLDNRFGILEGYLKIGDLHFRDGNNFKAETSLKKAREIAASIQHPRALALADFSLGKLWTQKKEFSKAEQALENAIVGVEQTRSNIEDENRLNELQISYFATMQDIYDEMIYLQLLMDQPKEAFYYSEQARARSLRDLLQSEDSSAPIGLKKSQNLLAANTTLLEYKFVKDDLICFVVQENNFSAVKLPRQREQTEAAIREFLTAIGANHYQDFLERTKQDGAGYYNSMSLSAKQLWQLLLSPIGSKPLQAEHLIIVPDGLLHYLPFAALVDSSNQFLIEKRVLSYLPAASLLNKQIGAQPAADWQLLAAATPEMGLPFTRQEVEAIAGYFQKSTLLSSMNELNEEQLLSHFNKQFEVIHLACHAEIDERTPRYSSIFVGPTSGIEKTSLLRSSEISDNRDDNNLMAHELYRLDFSNTKLIGLSACKSATGRYVSGEGMIGFIHPLMSAGAESVLATLWEISDEHTPKLMQLFYENWIEKKMGRAEALASAQRQIIQATRENSDINYAHPQLWAAFTLTGAHN